MRGHRLHPIRKDGSPKPPSIISQTVQFAPSLLARNQMCQTSQTSPDIETSLLKDTSCFEASETLAGKHPGRR